MMRGAEKGLLHGALGTEQVAERQDQARLADPCLTREQDDAPLPSLGLGPAAEHEIGFFLTVDERCFRRAQRLEAALEEIFADHAPDALRLTEALELLE